MLEKLVIHNFQSLKKVELELGKFTVIVGPSSSGKSAVLRAVRALASYARGSSVITSGEKSLAVSAHMQDHIVTFEKTATTGRYLLTDRATGETEKFSKLNQKVPEQITKVLNIQPVTTTDASLNFAGQFDKPYLLGESASHVAKVLGDLTNVSTIFEAVKAANKKKLAVGALLKTRKSDLDGLLEQAQLFAGLAALRDAVQASESLLEQAEALEARQGRLEEVVASLEHSEASLATLQQLPEVPNLDEVEQLHLRYNDFRS
jgi:DNA repair protein SbcC/Rad50